MTDFQRLLEALVSRGVDFVVIGGMAATAHGSAHVTVNLDVVYGRSSENLGRLAAALAPRSETREIFGLPVRFVDLETLIRLKRAAGRPKDLERIAELEAIAAERQSSGQDPP